MKTLVAMTVLSLLIVGCGTSEKADDLQDAELQKAQDALDDHTSIKLQDYALATAQLNRLADQARQTLALMDELESEILRWRDEIEPLLTDERGRRLASQDDLVGGFDAYYKARPRKRKEDVTAARVRVAAIAANVSKLLDDPTPRISEAALTGFSSEISTDRDDVEEALSGFQNSRQGIEGMLQRNRSQPPASVPLKDAIASRMARLAEDRARRIAQAEAEAYEKTTDRLVEIAREKEEELRRAEEAKFIAEQEAEKRRLAQEALEINAADPNIISRFAVFTQAGKTAICGLVLSGGSSTPQGTLCMKEFDGPSRPVSYTKLIEIGALETTQNFAWVTSHKLQSPYWGVRNDRPTWTYPQTDEDWSQLEEDFELFKLLAPIWAQNGTLAP